MWSLYQNHVIADNFVTYIQFCARFFLRAASHNENLFPLLILEGAFYKMKKISFHHRSPLLFFWPHKNETVNDYIPFRYSSSFFLKVQRIFLASLWSPFWCSSTLVPDTQQYYMILSYTRKIFKIIPFWTDSCLHRLFWWSVTSLALLQIVSPFFALVAVYCVSSL